MNRNRLFELLSVIASAGWWLLQMVDDADERWIILHFLLAHKIIVGLLLALIVILTILYDCYHENERRLRLHCNSIMKYISEKHFFTTDNSVRCTIFRPIGGKSLYLHLLWKLIIKKIFYNLVHCKIKESYIRVRQLVPDTSLMYLAIYMRYQHPKSNESNIAFPISTKLKEYGSAVECCFKKGDIVEVHTVDISQVNLTPNEYELKRHEKKMVKEYMEKSYISDYSTLNKMSTVANHIFAVPIILEDETTWGIMTIDFIGDENVLGTEENFPDRLKNYAKMISINIKYQ